VILSIPQFLDRFYPEIRRFSTALSECPGKGSLREIPSGEAYPANGRVNMPSHGFSVHVPSVVKYKMRHENGAGI